MAYGTPESPDQVEAYYTHIRGGHTPDASSVALLRRRYQAVGGRTPLLEITGEVRRKLEEALAAEHGPGSYRVYAGMKHWHPYIADVLPRIRDDGISNVLGIAMAPHYSRMSIGGYRSAVERAAAEMDAPPCVTFVDSWHLHQPFIQLIADRVRESLAQWPSGLRRQVVTMFSAHSLPTRIREWDDPYERELMASCAAVAEMAGVDNWRFAWQSAGRTGEPWLGPDILEVMDTLHAFGTRHVLSVPIGFVTDHLEVLYDIDREAQERARTLGMTLRRTRMPNADPAFISALASLVAQHT
jgi:ferrochelatase